MKRPRDPVGLEARRRVFERCYARYLSMRRAGRQGDAAEELRKASRVVDESVEHAIHALRQLLARIEKLAGDVE